MKTISYGLLLALFAIGVLINVIWGTGWGYVLVGGYALLWLIGAIRYRNKPNG